MLAKKHSGCLLFFEQTGGSSSSASSLGPQLASLSSRFGGTSAANTPPPPPTDTLFQAFVNRMKKEFSTEAVLRGGACSAPSNATGGAGPPGTTLSLNFGAARPKFAWVTENFASLRVPAEVGDAAGGRAHKKGVQVQEEIFGSVSFSVDSIVQRMLADASEQPVEQADVEMGDAADQAGDVSPLELDRPRCFEGNWQPDVSVEPSFSVFFIRLGLQKRVCEILSSLQKRKPGVGNQRFNFDSLNESGEGGEAAGDQSSPDLIVPPLFGMMDEGLLTPARGSKEPTFQYDRRGRSHVGPGLGPTRSADGKNGEGGRWEEQGGREESIAANSICHGSRGKGAGRGRGAGHRTSVSCREQVRPWGPQNCAENCKN